MKIGVKSKWCRKEWEYFRDEEREIDELVFPIYYITHAPFEDSNQRMHDKWLKELHAHQYLDLREYSLMGKKVFKNINVRRSIVTFVRHINTVILTAKEIPLISRFPFNEPTAADQFNWISDIVNWFTENYECAPIRSISKILNHVFSVIRYAQEKGERRSLDLVMTLGKELQVDLLTMPSNQRYHHDILKLIELGLHHNVSHLFFVPQIDKRKLVYIPDYSKLLLATRYFAAGDFQEASRLASNFQGSAIAEYIMGQCSRKMGLPLEAKSHYFESEQLLNTYGKDAAASAQLICNENLLRPRFDTFAFYVSSNKAVSAS